MFERHIIVILFVNIVFVILLSGCFSSLHQGQITDGYSATFALRPLPHEFVYDWGFAQSDWTANDIRASMAFRRGRAPLKKGESGYSVGIVADISVSPGIIKTHPQIGHDFPFFLRGSYYYQLPKNSIIDIGIGGEFGWPPVIPYMVMGRNFGDRFALYGEARSFWDSPNYHWAPTVGAKFDVSRDISLYAETSFVPKLLSCKYWEDIGGAGEQVECEYGKPFATAPAVGLGITFRGWDKKLFRKNPVLDDNGNIITEEEIRANIQSKTYGKNYCLGGCLGCLGSVVCMMCALLLLPESEPESELDSISEGIIGFFIGLGSVAVLTGPIIGNSIDDNQERRQAIEIIKAKRQQQNTIRPGENSN